MRLTHERSIKLPQFSEAEKMIFLDAIGGLKFEKQTSAVLHYLFVNSDTFRRKFVEHISGQFPTSRVPQFSNGILCQCEVGKKGIGSIDILVEADNCFLAIENKLWAGFQLEQPAKYGVIVEEKSLAKFLDSTNHRIVVIAPSQRNEEIRKHIAEQTFAQPCIVVYWQDVQTKMLRAVQEKGSPRNQVVAELLDEFIEQQIGKYAELNLPKEKLVGPDATITNQYQADFLYAIKSSFSDFNVTKMGFGKGTYAGFYFRVAQNRQANWFGFHNSPDGTVLQIHADVDRVPQDDFPSWSKQDLESPGRSFYFTFESDSWPVDRMDWQARIRPVIESILKCTDMDQVEPDTEATLE